MTAQGWAVVGPDGYPYLSTVGFKKKQAWAKSNARYGSAFLGLTQAELEAQGYTVQRVEVRVVEEADHGEA